MMNAGNRPLATVVAATSTKGRADLEQRRELGLGTKGN
jgi:hypothetical protein